MLIVSLFYNYDIIDLNNSIFFIHEIQREEEHLVQLITGWQLVLTLIQAKKFTNHSSYKIKNAEALSFGIFLCLIIF